MGTSGRVPLLSLLPVFRFGPTKSSHTLELAVAIIDLDSFCGHGLIAGAGRRPRLTRCRRQDSGSAVPGLARQAAGVLGGPIQRAFRGQRVRCGDTAIRGTMP